MRLWGLYRTHVDGSFDGASSTDVAYDCGVKDIIVGLEYMTELVANAFGYNVIRVDGNCI